MSSDRILNELSSLVMERVKASTKWWRVHPRPRRTKCTGHVQKKTWSFIER